MGHIWKPFTQDFKSKGDIEVLLWYKMCFFNLLLQEIFKIKARKNDSMIFLGYELYIFGRQPFFVVPNAGVRIMIFRLKSRFSYAFCPCFWHITSKLDTSKDARIKYYLGVSTKTLGELESYRETSYCIFIFVLTYECVNNNVCRLERIFWRVRGLMAPRSDRLNYMDAAS